MAMSAVQAVVLIDHHHAQVFQFDAEKVQSRKKVESHAHDTGQHGSGVRTEHEFFGEVCDALAGIGEVLVTGSHTAQSDFRHYIDKHRHALTKQIAGWETVDHPTEGQLVALGRKYFAEHVREGAAKPLPG